MTQDLIPPSREAIEEALILSDAILRNVELNEIPLTNIALKTGRLARLLNDFGWQNLFAYEAGGYPSTSKGVPPDVWQLAVAAGRKLETTDDKSGDVKEFVYIESIAQLEQQLSLAQASLAAAKDPDVSVSSANPNQFVYSPSGNFFERNTVRQAASRASSRLASRRSLIYNYAFRKHYELKFSKIASDVFARIRSRVDEGIEVRIPEALKRLTAIYDNLSSENPEDWSNAVHSCRRILQDLADALFPPQEQTMMVEVEGKPKAVKLGKDNYINRLIAFVQSKSASKRFSHLVGSHLGFMGDRLDSVFEAAQKGSHSTIISKEEADRYVVYTYLLVGDILSLA